MWESMVLALKKRIVETLGDYFKFLRRWFVKQKALYGFTALLELLFIIWGI